MADRTQSADVVSRLRRDLGTVESYAALIGILVGAGIFKVTSDAGAITGPSVILSYILLMPAILATSIPYAAYITTPLGREPGGEYLHISRTLGGFGIAYVGSWLKIIAYVGAGAYLASALADYIIELSGRRISGEFYHQLLAIGSLLLFYVIHVIGVRWFGRIQVAMCVLLGLAILVLVIPGLFAIHTSNYSPFFTHGSSGLAASFAPLFFSYAGFESLTLNMLACLILIVSKQLSLALNIAVFALVLLYFIHSVAFLMLPRMNPALNSQITISMPRWLQRLAAWVSVISMGGLIAMQIWRDLKTLRASSLSQRISEHSLTSLELAIAWSLVGAGLYALARAMRSAKSVPRA